MQVCLEGRLSSESVTKNANRGRQAAGDLIPWQISQYFLVSLSLFNVCKNAKILGQ
jgi:tRNA(Met) C34 N-acetyltransferase TmcA